MLQVSVCKCLMYGDIILHWLLFTIYTAKCATQQNHMKDNVWFSYESSVLLLTSVSVYIRLSFYCHLITIFFSQTYDVHMIIIWLPQVDYLILIIFSLYTCCTGPSMDNYIKLQWQIREWESWGCLLLDNFVNFTMLVLD